MRLISPVSLALAGALVVTACSGGAKGITAPREGDFSVGKADAPVTVTEYASASCTHCAQFNNEVFPQAKAKYVDTGQVHWVLREILTGPESVSAAGFLTARCAGPDKAYSVLDAIYRSMATPEQAQDFLVTEPRAALLRIAQSAGMTEKQFDDCVNDKKALEALTKRVQRNAKDGIKGTPTFFINGVQLDNEKEMSMARLDADIAAAKAGKDILAADKAATAATPAAAK
jgi:protein-disulfide isomerase